MVDRKEKLEKWLAKRELEKTQQPSQQDHSQKTSRPKMKIVGPNLKLQRETFSYAQKKMPYSKSLWAEDTNGENNGNMLNMLAGSTPANLNAIRHKLKTSNLVSTPTGKLTFEEGQGKMSTKKLREKLQAYSERKQQYTVEKAKKHGNMPKVEIKQEAINLSNMEQVRFNNLKRTVISQVAATKLLLTKHCYKEAKNDLSILYEEIPAAAEVGDFWINLAKVEQYLQGKSSSLMVFALALKTLSRSEELKCVNMALARFLQEFFYVEGFSSLNEVFSGESLEGAAVQDETNVGIIPSQKTSPIKVEQADDHISDAADLQAYLAPSPPREIHMKSPGRIKLEAPYIKSEAKRYYQRNLEVKDYNKKENLGSVVVLAAVNAKGKVKEDLGSERVLTPVRRASRHQSKNSEPHVVDLTETGYAYTPNKALSLQSENNRTPRPGYNGPKRYQKESFTPEAVRQELERLLLQ